ncbi:MAG TPA: hypothetical protein VGW34_10575 [Allosphingosinicella sp.]|nr:hypothetical protein [Allosphingosinicella sp.]
MTRLLIELACLLYGASVGAAMMALHWVTPAGEPRAERIKGLAWMLAWPIALLLILLIDGLAARRSRRARAARRAA